MINQTLVDYIKSVKAQGYENAAIIVALRNNGWQDKDINEAFGYVNLANQTPVMPTATPTANPLSGASPIKQAQNLSTEDIQEISKEKIENIN